jgi:hypothetical protein
MALITLVSVHFLVRNREIAIAISLLPLLLGFLNVFIKLGYAIAALSLVAAVAWAVKPPNARIEAEKVFSRMTSEFVGSLKNPDHKQHGNK